MLKAFLFCLAFLAGAFAEDLGIGMTSTTTLPVAPKCNSPVFLQKNPACASGTTVYLVAWSDGRQQPITNAADIYCARVEAGTGKILDSLGILVCHAADIQDHAAIAFDGTNFLVVWEDMRNRKDYDIYGARVSQAGQVLDAQPFVISARTGANEVRPTVTFAGGNFLVAWAGVKAEPIYGIYGCRVSSAGAVLDPQGIEIAAESDANIAAVQPVNGRYMGIRNEHQNWWYTLVSNVSPVLVTNGSRCLLSYNGGGRFCTINPVTGAFTHGPSIVPSWNYIGITGPGGGVAPTPNGGWMIHTNVLHGGWTVSAGYKAFRVDSALTLDSTSRLIPYQTEEDFVDVQNGGTIGSTRGGAYNFKTAAGTLKSSVLLAMEFVCKDNTIKTQIGQQYNSSIVLNRLGFTGTAYLETSPGIFLDKNIGLSGIRVGRPAICNGPNSECLLVYQKTTGLQNCLVVSKIISEK